jgi:hypothetical protein
MLLGGLLAAGLAVAAYLQTPRPAARPLAALAPAGPLLVLEAPDFAGLAADWEASAEKQLWLKSANFQEFVRSRLYLRLADAQKEFAAAAGVPPDMALVRAVAGSESLLALYDIGKLEFLYITRMPAARAAETVLWQSRAKFEPRNAAGTPYYLSTDKQSGRVVSFAAANDLLLLATREDLLAAALSLLPGKSVATVQDDRWFAESVRAAGKHGDLRLVMNIEGLIRTAYFRSYWIQRNVSDLKPFFAGVSDLYRSPTEIREERVFLRAAPPEAAAGPRPGVEPLLGLVPPDAGLYRAWATPSADGAIQLLARKILSPRAEGFVETRIAPRVVVTGGETGTEGDLETLIDEPPPQNAGAVFVPGPLRGALEAAGLQAMLEAQSTRPVPGGVFVRTEAVVTLLGSADWDSQAVRSALVAAVEGLWSRARLGLNWVENKRGSRTWYSLGGPAPLAVAAEGRYLLVSNSANLLGNELDRLGAAAPPAPAAIYTAGFRHAREKANYQQMMRALDYVSRPEGIEDALQARQAPEEGGEAPEAANSRVLSVQAGLLAPRQPPRFFSDNIQSLSDTLARVQSATITIRENGAAVNETVVYRLSK